MVINIPSPYELIHMIEKTNNDVEETILETNDLIERLKDNSFKFTLDLQDELKEYAENHNKCPVCGQDLETKTSYESSEYQGFPCKEEINEIYCPEHSD